MRDAVLTENGRIDDRTFSHHTSPRDRTSQYRQPNKVKPRTHIIKVREDVYLLHKTGNIIDQNLLANSITAQLKKDIPGEITIKTNLMNKLRRENLKDYLQLANLNRKFNSEMQREKNRLNNEGSQILKRQEQLRKHSEQSRKNQEKLNVQFENRRNSQSSSLPSLRQTENLSKAGNQESTSVPDRTYAYPRVPIDKEDTSYIKVFKHNGIFQPQNKYPDKRDTVTARKGEIGILKRMSQTPDYELVRLSPIDYDSVVHSPTKESSRERKKKTGLRVTWSGIDRELDRDTYDDGFKSDFQSQTLSRIDSVMSDASSQRSTKSDSALLQQMQYRKGRSRIETIGIKWKLPPGAKPDKNRSRSALSGNVSRNLIPCASAMNNVGTSVSRTRWGVPRPQSLDTHDMYKAWLEKLEKLKSPSESRQFLTAGLPGEDARSVEVTVQSLSEGQNASILASSNA